jgi:hypothetical protein
MERIATAGSNFAPAGYNHEAGVERDAGDVSWGEAMSRERLPDDRDLTESAEMVSAMSAAVSRLRQLAAAAFDATPENTAEVTAAQPGRPAAP